MHERVSEFEGTADECCDWKENENYYVVQWNYDRSTKTYILETI